MSIYFKASDVLREIEKHKGDVKSRIFERKDDPDFKKIYALVWGVKSVWPEIMLMYNKLQELIGDAAIKNENLAKIFLYDIVISQRKVKMGGALIRTIKQNREVLAALAPPKERKCEKFVSFRVRCPKRISHQLEEIVQAVKDLPRFFILKYEEYLQFNRESFPLYKSPNYVIQSLSAAVPVYLLWKHAKYLTGQFSVMETCAAPGNKTLQLRDYFREYPTFSFEKDVKRFQTLQKRIKFYCKKPRNSSKIFNTDFFNCAETLSQNEIESVRLVCADPSCSGSGMKNRLGKISENFSEDEIMNLTRSMSEDTRQRLMQLAEFQLTLLDFALCAFPNLLYLVYSTCSIYKEENEEVVARILTKHTNLEIVPLNPILNSRPGMNFLGNDEGESLRGSLRFLPNEPATDGFFVCLFKVNRNSSAQGRFPSFPVSTNN